MVGIIIGVCGVAVHDWPLVRVGIDIRMKSIAAHRGKTRAAAAGNLEADVDNMLKGIIVCQVMPPSHVPRTETNSDPICLSASRSE